jgi:hypothetical protein
MKHYKLCVVLVTMTYFVVVLPISALPSGTERFRNGVEGENFTQLLLYRDGTAELANRGENYVGKFTEEDNTIRLVFTILGTTQASYYKRTDYGLKMRDDDGYLLNDESYEKALESDSKGRALLELCKADEIVISEISELLKNGANVNYRESNVSFPMYYAVVRKNLELVKLLIEHGADVNSTAVWGRSLLHLNLFGPTNFERTKRTDADDEILKLLITKGADVNAVEGNDGATPLMVAVDKQLTAPIKILVAAGADRDFSSRRGATVWSIAARRGSKSIFESLRKNSEIQNFPEKIVGTWKWMDGHKSIYFTGEAIENGVHGKMKYETRRHSGSGEWTLKNAVLNVRGKLDDGSRYYGITTVIHISDRYFVTLGLLSDEVESSIGERMSKDE